MVSLHVLRWLWCDQADGSLRDACSWRLDEAQSGLVYGAPLGLGNYGVAESEVVPARSSVWWVDSPCARVLSGTAQQLLRFAWARGSGVLMGVSKRDSRGDWSSLAWEYFERKNRRTHGFKHTGNSEGKPENKQAITKPRTKTLKLWGWQVRWGLNILRCSMFTTAVHVQCVHKLGCAPCTCQVPRKARFCHAHNSSNKSTANVRSTALF